MNFDSMAFEVEEHGIEIIEYKLSNTRIKALYSDEIITLNAAYAATEVENKCVLAEELGHYYTSSGNILDINDLRNAKQEKRARNWAYEKLVPLDKLIEAFKDGVKNRFELTEFLDVTEEFIEGAIKHYRQKYGLCVRYSDCLIYFEPLGVLRQMEADI